jgi:2-aminoethylphosphonate-pyruvate transaminase
MRLLNPGPVTLSPRVRRALVGPDLCHRQDEFSELLGEVRTRLAGVYPAAERAFEAVLLSGSGTAAVEAMLGSLVPAGGKTLVLANGVYGERMAAILQAQGKCHQVLRAEWTAAIDLGRAEEMLAGDRGFTHVAAVHHETTTGRLNPLASLGAICRRHGVAMLLDTVSSFAGETIDFAGTELEACASTAGKCLHGVPGIAFVLVRREVLRDQPSAAASLYLDLHRNWKEQAKGQTPFTPAVQSLYALAEALRELEEGGGWPARHAHYRRLSAIVRQGLAARGLRLLLAEGDYSSILTSLRLPEGMGYAELYGRLKRERFVIYPGQQALFASIFRVAVMGDLKAEDMEEFVSCFNGIGRSVSD